MRSLLAWALMLCSGFVDTAISQSAVAPDDVAKKADAYMNLWASPGRFSGSVLLARNGHVLFRKAYGMANYELDVPNKPETIFRVGSITKTFTALCILQLEEKGLLSVDDPAAKYVSEIPRGWSAITIHQLLTHTSGIPDFTADPAYDDFDDPQRIEKALSNAADKPLLNPPGAAFRYSNAGYILLGRVIEKVAGKSYDDYVEENILRPAGMANTAYDYNTPLKKGRASGYAFDGETIVNTKQEDVRWNHSAGALSSTVDDMLRFDGMLASGRLVSYNSLNRAMTGYTDFVAPAPFFYQAKYGYGMILRDQEGHLQAGHGGWINGFVSQVSHYPNDGAVVIVLSNFTTANVDVIARDLGAILLGLPYQLPPVRKVVHPAPEVLKRYVGTYKMGPLESKITMKNGHLYAQGTGQPAPYALIATSDTEFFMNDMPADIRFVMGANGRPSAFRFVLDGREMIVERAGD